MKTLFSAFILTLLLFLVPSPDFAESTKEYTVYYFPVEAEFYIPLTRERIIANGERIELDSPLIVDLFTLIAGRKGSLPKEEDFKRLRVLIIKNKSKKEIFITSDKKIIADQKISDLEKRKINLILNEIESNLKEAKYGRDTIFRDNGFTLKIPADLRISSKTPVEDFTLCTVSTKDNIVLLNLYSGNHPNFPMSAPKNLVLEKSFLNGLRTECYEWKSDEHFSKECLVYMDEYRAFPQFIHFWYFGLNENQKRRAELVISSLTE